MSWTRQPIAVAGAVIVVVLAVVAVLAPVLAPYDPRALSGASLESPSGRHLLGTNNIGQDLLSQVIWGTRGSLTVAVGTATLTVGVGILVGVAAGLLGGPFDAVVMRVVDVLLAVPRLPLLIVVAAVTVPSRANVILVIGLMVWPIIARVTRGQTLSLRSRGFVSAARGFGGGLLYVMRRHLFPALGPIIVVGFVNVAAVAILLEAGLAFLGLADPTAVGWGLMLNRAVQQQGLYFTSMWVWSVIPAGLAVTVAVLGFTLLGVGLEPIFNPRWRRGS